MVKEANDYLIVHIETYYSDGAKLKVYVKSDIGGFWIHFPNSKVDNLRIIQPIDVRTMILYAKKDGWNPEDKTCYKEYVIDGENFGIKKEIVNEFTLGED